MTGTMPPGAEAEAERVFGLLLFEAEETLARGQVEKAVVLASRAVRERPNSLIARSLFDRTRREMTRGRRREKLEARVAEAQRLSESGDHAAAEKIVATVLKLLPDHQAALELFARLKDRRLQAGTVEAEAERELDAMMATRARQAAGRARTALGNGWSFRALMTVRRALALVPDDKELLKLYAESLRELSKTAGQRAIRRAAHARVLAAQGRLSQGEAAAAVTILRAVLKEDPGNPEARDALREMEHVASTAKATVKEHPAVITGRFTHRKIEPPAPGAKAAARPSPAARPRPTAASSSPSRAMWAVGAGVAALVVAGISMARREEAPPPVAAPAPPPAATLRAAAGPDIALGPLAAEDPELGRAVTEVLSRYAAALERVDARLLAAARPDLPAPERARLLARFQGAENVATDLRVQSVARRGGQALVSVLRTDVIVGRADATRPTPETLRFERGEDGVWVLRSPR